MTDLITRRALSFIEKQANQPFYVEVAYSAVHWPFQAPNRPEDVRDAETWYQGTRRDYQRMLERVDDGVGVILGALERKRISERTLVILSNDNGGEALSREFPLRGGKGNLLEGGIRVPCLARWPGSLPAGKICSVPAMTMDLTATILAAAGVPPQELGKLDGLDLTPILSGKKSGPERTLFWRIDRGPEGQWAARKGKWKYLRDDEGELLFDLEADVAELHDQTRRHPETVAQLRKEMARWEAEMARSHPRFSLK
jgi:arylsulfatase A-like enzyme